MLMNKYYTKHYKFAHRVAKKHTYNITSSMKYEINVKKGTDIPDNFFIQQVSLIHVPL